MEDKSKNSGWVVAVISGIFVLIAALIGIIPDLIELSKPTEPVIITATAQPTRVGAETAEVLTATPLVLTPTTTSTLIPPTPTIPFTPSPTLTGTPMPGPSSTPTVDSPYPFIQRGSPIVLAAATFPDHDECKLWIDGQTYDLQGAPKAGIIVMVGGDLDGKNLYQLGLTGTALQYGQAGYEFTVAEAPANSSKQVWIQLFDQSQSPISEKVTIDTFADCNRNLILVNFRQVR